MKCQIGSRKSLAVIVSSLILVLSSVSSSAFAAQSSKDQAPESVPGEFIIGFRNEASFLAAQGKIENNIRQFFGSNQVVSVNTLETQRKVQKFKIRDLKKVSAIMGMLRNMPQVKYVEPNYIYRAFAAPNDPEFARQWDMINTGQLDKPASEATPSNPGQTGTPGSDIQVQSLWDRGITGSKSVLVAVIDTGIDYNHPDLNANIFTNPNEIAGNGIDDDHNGIIDDVHGVDFSGTAPVGNGLDDHNHGTHCAGTIGAVGNNGLGIAGVNWDVTMLPLKFLTASGSGSSEGAIQAIAYATRMGVKVMSNSWGGGGFSQALFDVIKDARDAGILFVAAAGNDASNNDSRPSYPASYALDNVVSVAATDNRDAIASFSNYGRTSVHVAAPGKNILSTVRNGGYAIYSGTSMACPHVAGMAALLWSADSSLTYSEIKNRLISTSHPIRSLRSKSVAKGRVHTENAFQNFVPPSTEPSESAWRRQAYAVESAHPYANNANETFEISVPGATHIRVVFEQLDLESGWDFVTVKNAAGETIERVSGNTNGYVTDYVEGDKLILHFTSDYSENRYGFKISEIEAIR